MPFCLPARLRQRTVHVAAGGAHLHIAAALHAGAVLQRLAVPAAGKPRLVQRVGGAQTARHRGAVPLHTPQIVILPGHVPQQTAADLGLGGFLHGRLLSLGIQFDDGAGTVLQQRRTAAPVARSARPHPAVPHPQPLHTARIQCRNLMGVQMPRRRLFVKQPAGLGALAAERQVHRLGPDVVQRGVGFPRKEQAALRLHRDVVKADIADHTGKVVLPGPPGRVDKERFALAPPARGPRHRIAVGIPPHGPDQMVDLDVLDGAAVPHPDADGPGTVLHQTVPEGDVADVAAGLGADLQRGIPGVQHAVRDGHVAAGPVPAGHRPGRLDDDRIVAGVDQTAADDHILAAVRVNAVVVGAPVVVENADVPDAHAAASRHVQRPESRIPQRHVPDRQVGDVLQQDHPRAERRRGLGTFPEPVVLVAVKKYPAPLPVNDAAARDRDVLPAAGPQKKAAVPAVHRVVGVGMAERADVLGPQAGLQHRAAAQMQLHMGAQHHAAAEKPPRRHHDPASARLCGGIHRGLDGGGTVGHAVRDGAVFGDPILLHHGPSRTQSLGGVIQPRYLRMEVLGLLPAALRHWLGVVPISARKCRLKLDSDWNPTCPEMDRMESSLIRISEQALRMRVRLRCSSGPTDSSSRNTRRKCDWLMPHSRASVSMGKSSI